MPARGVRVTGTCKAGHKTTRDGELDPQGRPRLTWRGQCGTEGCELAIIARRVKEGAAPAKGVAGTIPAQPPPTTEPPAGEPPAEKRTIRKVTGYREPAKRAATKRRPGKRPGVPPTTEPVPAVGPPAVVDDKDEPGPEPRRRRFSLGGRDIRDTDTIPGIY